MSCWITIAVTQASASPNVSAPNTDLTILLDFTLTKHVSEPRFCLDFIYIVHEISDDSSILPLKNHVRIL